MPAPDPLRRPRSRRAAALAAPFTAMAALAGAALAADTVRLAASAFDESAEVEIAGGAREAARAAAIEALASLRAAETELRALEGRLAEAGGEPVALSPEMLELLVRADGFCRWSEGSVSVLGGKVLRLWGVRFPSPGRPSPDVLAGAVESAQCARLALDRGASSARVAPGTEVDFLPFELGWAVDRAAAGLVARGVDNFRLRLGPVVRGAGPGPRAKGWRVEFPRLAGSERPLDGFFLRDRAAAILTAQERPIFFGGDPQPRWIDLARGSPPQGLVAVAVVTEIATDAQGLAWAMFARGQKAGEMALGSLRPLPSVLWAIGRGEGEPLLAVSRWSAVPKR